MPGDHTRTQLHTMWSYGDTLARYSLSTTLWPVFKSTNNIAFMVTILLASAKDVWRMLTSRDNRGDHAE